MALLDQRHTVRWPLPDLIVRDVAHTLYAPVYLDGALVVPDSATVTVYNASNAAVIPTAAATITGSIATYAIGSSVLAAESFGLRWRVEWAITLSTGEVLTPRNSAALVRNGLWPVITDEDIYRRMKSLDPNGGAPITTLATCQDELDEAWTEINSRLIGLGNRPNLIMEPSALRMAHMYLTLAIIFEGSLSSRISSAYDDKATDWRALYEAAWLSLSPEYDTSDSGQADTRRRPAMPSVWLCGGRG